MNVWIVRQGDGVRGIHASQVGAEREIADICGEHPDLQRSDFIIHCDRIRGGGVNGSTRDLKSSPSSLRTRAEQHLRRRDHQSCGACVALIHELLSLIAPSEQTADATGISCAGGHRQRQPQCPSCHDMMRYIAAYAPSEQTWQPEALEKAYRDLRDAAGYVWNMANHGVFNRTVVEVLHRELSKLLPSPPPSVLREGERQEHKILTAGDSANPTRALNTHGQTGSEAASADTSGPANAEAVAKNVRAIRQEAERPAVRTEPALPPPALRAGEQTTEETARGRGSATAYRTTGETT